VTGKLFKASTKTTNSELQTYNRTRRPLGSDEFIKCAEKLLKRDNLMKRKLEPKPNEIN
jgi:hypothetical protein